MSQALQYANFSPTVSNIVKWVIAGTADDANPARQKEGENDGLGTYLICG